MSVIKVNKNNFEQEVIQSDKIVLVDFFASWCGPCKMLSPIVDEVAEEVKDIKVCKIDIDEDSNLANKYNIMSVPTLVVFKAGDVFKKSIGLIKKEQILDLIK